MKKKILLFVFLIVHIALFAQNETLTNKTIIDMLEMGFGDDIITTKISTSETNFDTSIQALKSLKEHGVSSDVIVAIINTDKARKKGNENIAKDSIGIYYKTSKEYSKLYPSSFRGTSSHTLGSAVTPFVSNTKSKAQLDGVHATNVINTNIPEFIFYFDKKIAHESKSLDWCFSVASSPKEFVLVKMIKQKDKRELKTGEIDIYSGKFIGVESKEIIQCTAETINETTFRVKPSTDMKTGEYCFFYQGSAPQSYQGNTPVFDFSIPENHKIENKFNTDQTVWIIKNGEPKRVEVMRIISKNDGIYYSLRSRNSWEIEEYKESDCYPTKEEANNATEIKN